MAFLFFELSLTPTCGSCFIVVIDVGIPGKGVEKPLEVFINGRSLDGPFTQFLPVVRLLRLLTCNTEHVCARWEPQKRTDSISNVSHYVTFNLAGILVSNVTGQIKSRHVRLPLFSWFPLFCFDFPLFSSLSVYNSNGIVSFSLFFLSSFPFSSFFMDSYSHACKRLVRGQGTRYCIHVSCQLCLTLQKVPWKCANVFHVLMNKFVANTQSWRYYTLMM